MLKPYCSKCARPWRKLSLGLLAGVLWLTSGWPVGVEAGLSKIDPWVQAQTASGAAVEALVVLQSQADLSGAAGLPTKAEKGRYVYQALQETARQSQAGLLAWLTAHQVEYRSFYIVNAVWVRANAAVLRQLAAQPEVARIEGNPRLQPNLPSLLEAPMAPQQPAGIEPNLTYIHAPEVWAKGFTGQGVVIGGQDTGYQWDHPALKAHYRGWTGTTATHDYNWHDSIHSGGGVCGANSPVPCDDYGHGTHTMGTALGDDGAGNQIGVAPGARWIGCRNMDVGAGSPATYLECFEFFLAPYPVGGTPAEGDPARAPDVTINSWTCPALEGCAAGTLLAATVAQRAAGILTVVAAGNSGSGCATIADPPSFYASTYTVGALVTGTDTLAVFSSRGPATADGSQRIKPDITAPGTSIRSSIPISGYGFMQGTSMATPAVAGAVALLWSARPEMRRSLDLTQWVLNTTAAHVSVTNGCGSSGWPNNLFGYGRLNALAAVEWYRHYFAYIVQ